MSDAEKLVEAGVKYSDDPLILRPRVGGDFLRSHHSAGLCWPRSFVLRLMLFCVILATVTGCILIIFTLRHSSIWPWHHGRRAAYRDGFCRALTPFPGLDLPERYFYEPNAITISHGPVAGFPPVSIFHLLADAITVMRTPATCYIYPLTREAAEAVPVDDTIVQRIKESHDPSMVQFKSPFEMRVFMVDPNSGERIQINHPAAAANCSDVPIFRLIEMVLPHAAVQLSPGSEAAMHPVACSKECPPGESRDSLGVPRQVCRCPPKEVPPIDFQKISDNDDTEEFQPNVQAPDEEVEDGSPSDESEDEDESDSDFGDTVDEMPGSFSGDMLTRRGRAVELLRNMEPPVQIPSDCRVVDKVLADALPNAANHTLPLITVVQC